MREFGASYVKLWPGQDGWDYPFQVDHHKLWQMSMDGVAQLAQENPDLKFVIEYKPREPRVHMSYDSVSRTLLALEKIDLPNIGILLDFGHALYGGESPADSAQLAIDYGRLFGMDVNDNLRSWDDDMIAGSVHPMELFEFFYVLAKNNWDGVWQLDQFPFREDTVGAAKQAIRFLRRVERGLERWTSLRCRRLRMPRTRWKPRGSPPTPCSETWQTDPDFERIVEASVEYAQPASRLRLVTRVARMYHEQDLKQPQIAELLHVSQAKVSRLLKRAEELGIVKVLIVPPSGGHSELEEALVSRYGLARRGGGRRAVR